LNNGQHLPVVVLCTKRWSDNNSRQQKQDRFIKSETISISMIRAEIM